MCVCVCPSCARLAKPLLEKGDLSHRYTIDYVIDVLLVCMKVSVRSAGVGVARELAGEPYVAVARLGEPRNREVPQTVRGKSV